MMGERARTRQEGPSEVKMWTQNLANGYMAVAKFYSFLSSNKNVEGLGKRDCSIYFVLFQFVALPGSAESSLHDFSK